MWQSASRIVLRAPLCLLWLAAASSWSLSLASSSSSPPSLSRGLYNLGNTCYLNSQLQCAYHIPLVRRLVESPPAPAPAPAPARSTPKQDDQESCNPQEGENTGSDSTSSEDDTRDPASQQQDQNTKQQHAEVEPEPVSVQALRKVFRDMDSSSGPLAPRMFCEALGIPVMVQQDSQEFWKLLLPALKVPALTDLYQGCFEDYIKAMDGSNREKRREEPFLDLSIDVSRNSVVEGLKAAFGSPELLSEKEGNGWRPEKGADKVDALKGSLLRVQGLPSILQLHLKRFNYDWQTGQMSKINDRCSFPRELDLSTICEDIKENEKASAKYDLQSVVIHTGEYGAGHYYAYVRPDIRKDEWYRFNDHIIEKVTFEDVIADSFGGLNARPNQESKANKKRGPGGLLRRLTSSFRQKDPYGYGGRTANAYVVQYVRNCDIPTLYCCDNSN